MTFYLKIDTMVLIKTLMKGENNSK